MEDQVIRTRRRIPRKRSFGERLERLIGAPSLPHAHRNQRLAIVAMVLLLGVYLVFWPIVSDMFGGTSREAASQTSPARPSLGKKK